MLDFFIIEKSRFVYIKTIIPLALVISGELISQLEAPCLVGYQFTYDSSSWNNCEMWIQGHTAVCKISLPTTENIIYISSILHVSRSVRVLVELMAYCFKVTDEGSAG